MLQFADQLDSQLTAIYLQVPGSQVVLLQAMFELYEGVAVVRTLSIKKSLVAILTTPSMLKVCEGVLDSIKDQIPWQEIARPAEAVEQLIMGYFKGKHAC